MGTQLRGALPTTGYRADPGQQGAGHKLSGFSCPGRRAAVDTNSYIPLMKQLGYDPNDKSTDIETPAGIGNVACATVLEFRHQNKSNQLGDLA